MKSLTKDAGELLKFYGVPADQNDEFDRISFSTVTAQDKKDEELWQPENNVCDDVQIIPTGGEGVAQTARIQRDSLCSGRGAISRRFKNGKRRRLTACWRIRSISLIPRNLTITRA